MGKNLDQKMMFGGGAFTGVDSFQCQAFLAKKCAKNWDGVCNELYTSANDEWPGTLPKATFGGITPLSELTAGDQILAQSVRERFRVRMLNEGSSQCELRIEPFDYTRPDSPSISYYIGNNCIPEYMPPPPSKCNSDRVLNLLLDRPHIASDVLFNMFNTLKQKNMLSSYRGTRLGSFFESNFN
jgi:hypothetical protein